MSELRFGAVLVLLGGCGLSEDKFQDKYVSLGCEASTACADEATGAVITFDSQEDCEAFLGAFVAAGTAGCDYDGAAAKDCLADLEAPDCDLVNSGGSAASCETVYSGEACGWFAQSTSSTP